MQLSMIEAVTRGGKKHEATQALAKRLMTDRSLSMFTNGDIV
jgi:hypothetical protein